VRPPIITGRRILPAKNHTILYTLERVELSAQGHRGGV